MSLSYSILIKLIILSSPDSGYDFVHNILSFIMRKDCFFGKFNLWNSYIFCKLRTDEIGIRGQPHLNNRGQERTRKGAFQRPCLGTLLGMSTFMKGI